MSKFSITISVIVILFAGFLSYTLWDYKTNIIPTYTKECVAEGGNTVYDPGSKSMLPTCWNMKNGTRIFIDNH